MHEQRRMPRLGAAAILLLTVTLAAGCGPLFERTVRGSGQVEQRVVELDDVTEVRVGSALNAEIVPGDEPSVTVLADDNVLEHIEVNERGDRVEMRVEPRVRLRSATVRITVALPTVAEVAASGAANVEVADGLDVEDPRMTSSGASTLRGTVDAARLSVSASGASDVDLAGSAERLEVTASGASEADLRGLTVAGDAQAQASGASEVAVNVSGSLSAQASGASEVRYVGSPGDVSTETSGASSVEQED